VQRKDSYLKTPTHDKINDFIRATASVRMSLERTGDFQNHQRDFGALCRKTNFYCNYYLVKIHLRNRTAKGLAKQMREVRKNLRYYQSDQFKAEVQSGKSPVMLPDALPPHRTAIQR
jgi:hypothetical protein